MKIGVLGAGSWGSTLAHLLQGNNHEVTLWSWSSEDAETMRSSGRNLHYLPELDLEPGLVITDDIDDATRQMDMLLLSTPSQHIREVLSTVKHSILGSPIIVNVAKGIENKTLLRMSEVVHEMLPELQPDCYTVLSGPSHAEEVSTQRPTSVVAASSNSRTTAAVIDAFMTDYFRVYSSSDVIGVELGGSLKNVIAIGAGICDGSRLGDNAKAAMITRGIAEIRRLGVASSAEQHTFAGLSGLGDLIVTTMSRHSRNRYVGEEIGRGKKLDQILDEMEMIAEGVDTTSSVHQLALRENVEMPITHQVHAILFEGKDPIVATKELMSRQAKDEVWF